MKQTYPIRRYWCCLFLCLLFIPAPLFAQTVQWAQTLHGNYTGNFNVTATDSEGNVFVQGEYTGTVRHGATSLPGAYPATYDKVLLKYGPGREALWYKKNRGMGNGILTVGLTDGQGNYYELSGHTNGVFDNTILQPNGTTAYLTKYSPAGVRQWIKFMEGGFPYPVRLFLNASDALTFSVNVEGELRYSDQLVPAENGDARLLQLNTQTGELVSESQSEPYTNFRIDGEGFFYKTGKHHAPIVQKQDAAGQVLWQKDIVSTGTTFISNLEVDPEGNSYVTGTYCGQVTIDQWVLTGTCSSQGAGQSVFLAKFDKNGQTQWVKGLGEYYMGGLIRLLPRPDGGLYLPGINTTNLSLLDTPVQPGLYIARLTEDGEILWLRNFESSQPLVQLGLHAYPNGLLLSGALHETLAVNELNLDGHTVTKEAGSHTFFFAFLKDDVVCPLMPQVQVPVARCFGTPPPRLSAAGEGIRWYGNASLTDLLAEGSEFQPAHTTTASLYVTQTVQGCQSRPRVVAVEVKEKPSKPIAPGIAVCAGEAAVLIAQGQDLQWYQNASLSTRVATGPAFEPILSESASFYVTQTVEGCESEATAVMAVRYQAAPPAPEVNSVYVCDGTLQEPLLARGSDISWYADAALTQEIGQGPTYAPARAAAGLVYVTQRLNGCESVAAIAEIKAGNTDFLKEKLANIITPNHDGLNDTFRMPFLTEGSCIGNFKRITILNRWGQSVYDSTKADFSWHAEGQAAGVYFYLLSFDSFSYRGSLTVNR
ncbi:hypothetical protein DXT99_00110 [Pontibacter diazotrophicus]|uniref:Ig-like domain-containing protein n=1 Tax=Pontibacter diazotrophicus TaxID=1400979 RepID=A0A3D8LHP8_9BACT|nr:gliding motility-associated C-terminal domain-containing protein [Pontibacter diazotrophicus]RDV16963.1 hypothetical protein DXT99_00110 [Pontibacter diazotrophicus]